MSAILYQHLLNFLGAEDHEDAARIIARHHTREILDPDVLNALRKAEAALSDIGDADREEGDDVTWCEARAAEAIPTVRAAISALSVIARATGEQK